MRKAPFSKRPRYDATFRAEALRLASESRSTLVVAQALNSKVKLLYQWQKAAQQPLPADLHEAAEVPLRAQVRRQTQKLEIFKKPLSSFLLFRPCESVAVYGPAAISLPSSVALPGPTRDA